MRYSRKQIAKALATAKRALNGPASPVAKVAAVLSPYMDCTEVDGTNGQTSDDLRSEIFAAMADAYRHEGNVALATKWYRRASQISPGEHAAIYAHLVCQHQLAEFYEDALKTLQERRGRWRAQPIIKRFFLRLGMWTDPETRELACHEKRNLRFLLQQQSVPKAA